MKTKEITRLINKERSLINKKRTQLMMMEMRIRLKQSKIIKSNNKMQSHALH